MKTVMVMYDRFQGFSYFRAEDLVIVRVSLLQKGLQKYERLRINQGRRIGWLKDAMIACASNVRGENEHCQRSPLPHQ